MISPANAITLARRSPRRRLRRMEATFLRPHRRSMLIALMALLLQSLLVLPLPRLQGWVIDQLSALSHKASPSRESLVSLMLAAAAIPLVCLTARTALSWFSSGLMNRVSLEFVRTLTDSLHRK